MSEKKKRSSGYYARIMGTFWRHPRTLSLSLAARGLWVTLLSWSADQRSDGHVPVAAMQMACGGQSMARALEELRASGMVSDVADGYLLRDWSQHNTTRADHDSYKEQKRKEVADRRARSESVPRNISGTEQEHARNAHVHVLDLRSEEEGAPAPSSDRPRSIEPARQAIVAAYRKRGLAVPGQVSSLAPDYETHARLSGLDAERLPVMLEAFFGDSAMASKGFPIAWFLANPNQWARPTTPTPQGGLPADLDDLERLALTRADEGRPWAASSKIEAAWLRVAERHPGLVASRKHPGYAQPATRPAA